jgi:hypothetical protein
MFGKPLRVLSIVRRLTGDRRSQRNLLLASEIGTPPGSAALFFKKSGGMPKDVMVWCEGRGLFVPHKATGERPQVC